jgi:threonine aldolase
MAHVSICFSKGLGTPLGTVLIGKNKLMQNAIRVRKVLGGGMRQVGYVAAAGLYSLENNIERIADDHTRAKEIAACLDQQEYVKSLEQTETNIVIFYLRESHSEEKFMDDLLQENIKISNMGQGKLRIVTHLDYTSDMHTRFLDFLSSYK